MAYPGMLFPNHVVLYFSDDSDHGAFIELTQSRSARETDLGRVKVFPVRETPRFGEPLGLGS